MKLFEKTYNDEGLYDLPEDIGDAMDGNYNKLMTKLPVDEYGFILGQFKVTVEWLPPENEEEE